ncbi:MFS transporter [Streptomyces sp. J2-1]|uniref:MFS transporter n=1 Tax=Streptomyces corallincola TaxID=2851888 RepID=UPI001C38964F|nr:MFS transporter [Streptomyces corallincola]MBV2354116.1 MFS transporter [Streptomyces corallincola]
MNAPRTKSASPFRQPRAVWAVAFACVISFMGIGLVDPILPALASSLHATPSQVSLLFSSYLIVTAVAMLVVGWVSSRIGAKRTLVTGLGIIVVFAALAGSSGSIGGIVGFRAGWGLGNALFIATSLAVIVASASGGFGGAIILYETALGLGIAVGPLLGGELGAISWRGPFFGVAALMAIALVATLAFVPALPRPARPTSPLAPLRALRHRGLLVMGIMALLYNWGFFTMLGYAPYPMELDAHRLGLVFTGWGLLVAAFSVFFAPRLQARFGTAPVLYANLAALGVVMAVIAAGVGTPAVVIVAVILSGACIGINNTLTTQAVMLVSPVERPVASSAYGFLRFIGGGLAPYVAGRLADATDLSVPFYLGAGTFLLAIPVLASGHGLLRRAEEREAEPETVQAPAPAPSFTSVRALAPAGAPPVVVAVGSDEGAGAVVDAAARLARATGSPLEVVHVRRTAVVEGQAAETETDEGARAAVTAHLDRLTARGVVAAGQILTSVGDHAAAGRALARHAADAQARAVAIGRSPRGPLAQFADGSFTAALVHGADRTVVLVDPDAAPRTLTEANLAELRDSA